MHVESETDTDRAQIEAEQAKRKKGGRRREEVREKKDRRRLP